MGKWGNATPEDFAKAAELHAAAAGKPRPARTKPATTDVLAIQIGKMKFMRSLSSYGDFDAVSKQLSAMLKSRHAEKGTIIFKKDDMGDEMYLIRRGEVEIYTARADKDILLDMEPIAKLTDSDNFGESVLLVEVRATALPHTRACTHTHGLVQTQMQAFT